MFFSFKDIEFLVSNEATSSCRWEGKAAARLTGVAKFPTKRLHPVAGRQLEAIDGITGVVTFPTKRLHPVAGSI